MIKVVAFNGSPREKGNTALSLGLVTAELEKEGIQTETISLSGQHLRGCIACGKCFENKNRRCVIPSRSWSKWTSRQCCASCRLRRSSVAGLPSASGSETSPKRQAPSDALKAPSASIFSKGSGRKGRTSGPASQSMSKCRA